MAAPGDSGSGETVDAEWVGPGGRWVAGQDSGRPTRRRIPPALLALLVGALTLSLVVSRPTGGAATDPRPATAGAAATGTPAAVAPVRPSGFVTAGQAASDTRVVEAMALIDYPWAERLPGWEISFEARDEDYFGMTLVPDRRIEIYVRDDQTTTDLAGVVAHELGHAVDVTLMCWADRYEWLRARGHEPTERWYVDDGDSDFHSGAGDFAEAFAVAQVGRASWSTFAGAPTAEHLDLARRLADQPVPADERC